jgi:hypothetical protein
MAVQTVVRRLNKRATVLPRAAGRAPSAGLTSSANALISEELELSALEAGRGRRQGIATTRMVDLPCDLEDSRGNRFRLDHVFLQQYPFGLGVLRFSLISLTALNAQAILDVQNAVMRLGVRCNGVCDGVMLCVCVMV